jgi:5-methylthioribose kinase
MRELTSENIVQYLRQTQRVPEGIPIAVRELSGGVSNVVLRIDVAGRPPIVIKQCRERLRVAMDWRAGLDRIWAERATLDVLGAILPRGAVPEVLFEDRPEYLFAMSCAPDDSATWKTHLMNGRVDPEIALRLGTILAAIHADAHGHSALRETLADISLFDELRIDPYYRTIARAHPAIAPQIDALIAAMERSESQRTLVLGDFSPKNILIHSRGLILLDFECAHAGDATFDLGFFLSHLVLKSLHLGRQSAAMKRRCVDLSLAFWAAYLERIEQGSWRVDGLIPRSIEHASACLLARVDGKSPVEYLDPATQNSVRRLAIEALQTRPESWADFLRLLERLEA